MALSSGLTGSTQQKVAELRRIYGLSSDSASDQIWVNRITSGAASLRDAERRLAEKAVQLGVHPRLNQSGPYSHLKGRTSGGSTSGGGTTKPGKTPEELAAEERARQEAARRAEAARTSEMVSKSLGIPAALASVFRDEYVRSGDINLALAAVRQSGKYDTYYPGNRREDGTIRYTEPEYQSVIDAYADSLADYGVNPDVYARQFGKLISGDVSAQEFRGRVAGLYDVIGLRLNDENAGTAFRQQFAAEFGVDPTKVNMSTVLGVALDPEIGQDVLERRLSIVQVTANASRFGFSRSRARAEALLNSGMQGGQAQEFYTAAADKLPRFGAYAGRFNEGQFGIEEFEDAFALGDVDDAQRANRLIGREASLFSQSGQVRQDQEGSLLGLQQR